jgi:hypothetical protein
MEAGRGTGAKPVAAAPQRLNVVYHVVIGIAVGLVSLITLLAWPFAILTGIVVGKASSDRRLGRRQSASVLQLLAVTGGVLGMLLFGALVGGLIAFLVVGLVAFSERVAEHTSPVDQIMARIIVVFVAVLAYGAGWFGLAALGFQINLSFGT